MVGVTDEAINDALSVLHDAGVAAEPSGAVALAGAMRAGFHGRAVVIVSGGNTSDALSAMTADNPPGCAAPLIV